jgi:repressor LexA
MQLAADAMHAARHQIDAADSIGRPDATASAGAPTRQQGQFLAYISEYIAANRAGVAPSHADLQRFFNLTPPSVNSMLVRLERCGFIRRVPGKARAIEVLVAAAHLPPLDRPFKF